MHTDYFSPLLSLDYSVSLDNDPDSASLDTNGPSQLNVNIKKVDDKPELPETDQHVLHQAILHIMNVFDSKFLIDPCNSNTSRRAYSWSINFGWLFNWTAVGYVLMTFFERPLWCIRADELDLDYCKGNRYYPTTKTYMLDRWTAFWIEIVFCSILTFEILLLIIALRQRFFRSRSHVLNLIFLSATVIDVVYAYTTPYTWIRFAPFWRICIFANRSRDVRTQLKLLIQILPRFGALCLVAFLFLSCFAFIGTLLFSQVEQSYFGSMDKSLWSLLVLMTTCNFPDVMIDAFNQDMTSFVFFVVFLIISVFFLVNLVVAVVYNVYTEQDEKEQERALQSTEQHLRCAFELLDVEAKGYLTQKQFYDLIDKMRNFRNLASFIDLGHVNLIFAALDNDATGTLSLPNFMQLCTVVHVKFERVEEDTFLERTYPRLFKSQFFMYFKAVITSPYYEWIMQAVLIVMAGFTIWESWDNLQGDTPSSKRTDRIPDSLWNWVEFIFTIVFIVEALVKILAYGWKQYWRNFELEFIVTVLCTSVTIVVYIPNKINDTVWIRYTLLLRLLGLLRLLRFISLPSVLRLLRLLTTISHFKIFYQTFLNMIPPVIKVIKILFTVMYIFSALGVQLFGGRINTDPDSQYFMQLQTNAKTYLDSKYYNINMNDMIRAMITMFQLLVLNNWMVFAEAFVAVSDSWAHWYFISYYVVCVVGIMNIVVATVIDTFLKEYQNYKVELEAEGEASICGGEAVFNAEYITGTRTGMYGQYRAVLQGYQDSKQKSQQLLKMFERVEREHNHQLQRELTRQISLLEEAPHLPSSFCNDVQTQPEPVSQSGNSRQPQLRSYSLDIDRKRSLDKSLTFEKYIREADKR
eukprot:TRINITY_DN1935_c0_g1_i5.p1 TRINITY_DN1935_c0_g1~~TRINITY_DN1935_c0_g1_i5.p1  ORF type:complete len:916 (-),score=43.82 TRINITY_DN1935_c0_g1_i5:1087-3675(-)